MKHKLLLTFFALLVMGVALVAAPLPTLATSKPHVLNNHTKVIGHVDSNRKLVFNAGVSLPKPAKVSPNINRVPCSGNDFFKLYTDKGNDIICFANAGETNVLIYDTVKIYTGNNTGFIIWDDNVSIYETDFPTKYTDYDANYLTGGRYSAVPFLDVIHIN